MLEINLLPAEWKKKNKRKDMLKLPLIFFLLLISVVIGVVVAHQWQIIQYNWQRQEVEQALSSVDYLKDEIASWEKEKKQTEQNEQWKNSLEQEKVEVAYFLWQLTHVVPQNLWLTNLSIQGKNVHIEGKALSYGALVTFLDNLQAEHCFSQSPVLLNSQAASLGAGSKVNLVTFSIKGTLLGGQVK